MNWPGILMAAGGTLIAIAGGLAYLLRMPGQSVSSQLPDIDPFEREIVSRLKKHVEALAGDIGGRSAARPSSLDRAVQYLEQELRGYGYSPLRNTYRYEGVELHNVEARGERGTVVVGAHYDTAGGMPGANDNASGVAAVLTLAWMFRDHQARRFLRFVLFANEEPPYFQSPGMGSLVYARRCHQAGEQIEAMLSLETIGYYTDERGSQSYPWGIRAGYPDEGNFLAFVGNVRSAPLLRRVVERFRGSTTLPAEGAAAPESIPGIAWSDHWSFWQFGYRALMVTDTAPYRYPYYHTKEDTPEKLDYMRMAQAVLGLYGVLLDLAGSKQ